MWVPMLVLAACIYFVCKDRAMKFARFVDSWSHVIQIIDVVRCMQANHSVLSTTWRWGWPRFEQSKVFLLEFQADARLPVSQPTNYSPMHSGIV